MKILIVGGGMAGPALACFLGDDPRFDVTLVEQAPEFKNIGFCLSLWGNGVKMLEHLGLKHVVEKKGYEVPWLGVEGEHEKPLIEVFISIFKSFGGLTMVPRADIQTALVERMKTLKTKIIMGTRLELCEQKGDQVEVKLSNGSVEKYDLVVGADGVHSRVRDQVFGTQYLKDFGWSGWVFWAAAAPDFARGIVEAPRNGSACFTFPGQEKSFMMLIEKNRDAFTKSTRPADELYNLAPHYSENFQKSMLVAAKEGPVFFDSLRHVQMPIWYKGRVVLVGDAQHATTPITGMGASLAFEDVYVLAQELKKLDLSDSIDPMLALKRFSRRRTKRIRTFSTMAHRVEGWLMINGVRATIRNIIFRSKMAWYFTRPVRKILKSPV